MTKAEAVTTLVILFLGFFFYILHLVRKPPIKYTLEKKAKLIKWKYSPKEEENPDEKKVEECGWETDQGVTWENFQVKKMKTSTNN